MPRPKKWAQTLLARLVAKYGFSRRGEPLGQDFAAVLAGDVGRRAAEELGRHHAAADGCFTSPPPELKTIVSR